MAHRGASGQDDPKYTLTGGDDLTANDSDPASRSRRSRRRNYCIDNGEALVFEAY